jgi:predicted kinase
MRKKENKMPHCIFLIGIPCSGKSTYAKKQEGYTIISRDNIRELAYGRNPKYRQIDEVLINQIFDALLEKAVAEGANVIIDNTNLRTKYIRSIQRKLPGYSFGLKYFEKSLWIIHYRNVKRWLQTGKWIPIPVINNMNKQYKKLMNEQPLVYK